MSTAIANDPGVLPAGSVPRRKVGPREGAPPGLSRCINDVEPSLFLWPNTVINRLPLAVANSVGATTWGATTVNSTAGDSTAAPPTK
jgi:hypothetical protein